MYPSRCALTRWTQLLLDEAGIEGFAISDDPRSLLDRDQGWGSDDTEAFKTGGQMGHDFEFSEALIDLVHDRLHITKSGVNYGVGVMIYPMGSPIVRSIAPSATAYGPRNASWVLHYKHQWIAGNESKREIMLEHHKQFALSLEQLMPCRAWYNYIDNSLPCARQSGSASINDAWLHAYFQDNEHRMKAIKAREDPRGVFKSRLWPRRKTFVEIRGEEWWVNGRPTYQGRMWKGQSMQGTLHNARMVNALFDDYNEDTRVLWKYPDTGHWSAERNTQEFLHHLTSYAQKGLSAVTVALQGGSPCGISPVDGHFPCTDAAQTDSSAFTASGSLRRVHFERLRWIMDAADELGVVIILQLFTNDQAGKTFRGDDESVLKAADNVVDWLVEHAWRNYVIDVCDECDLCRISHTGCSDARTALKSLNWPYQDHYPSITAGHHGELPQMIERIRSRLAGHGVHQPISTAYLGGEKPLQAEYQHLDFVNLHATNLWQSPDGNLAHMVDEVRAMPEFVAKKMPIIISQDDGLCAQDGTMSWDSAHSILLDPRTQLYDEGTSCQFHFDDCEPTRTSNCAFGNAVAAKVGWGLYLSCCGFRTCPANSHSYTHSASFQCPPINWAIDSSPNKRAFFDLLGEATGGLPAMPSHPSPPPPAPPPPAPLTPPYPHNPPPLPPTLPPPLNPPPPQTPSGSTPTTSMIASSSMGVSVLFAAATIAVVALGGTHRGRRKLRDWLTGDAPKGGGFRVQSKRKTKPAPVKVVYADSDSDDSPIPCDKTSIYRVRNDHDDIGDKDEIQHLQDILRSSQRTGVKVVGGRPSKPTQEPKRNKEPKRGDKGSKRRELEERARLADGEQLLPDKDGLYTL
mmetsp:Transcript_42701/g.112379  ORF Transcript_42701/g.112379 Transcript_42701/m.112379 type:complete len:857 (+) Transcript_42701:86-2656(+)